MKHDPMQRGPQPVSLRGARRCGAKTRSGQPCRSPAVRGRPRCRMHGCGRGGGGPPGERNGNYRHGLHTKNAKADGASVRKLLREARDLIKGSGNRA
jgi:periplasmic glucans biosynthesis protein